MNLRRAAFGELTVDELYAILRLRNEVFVVEQDCAYLDIDGRDTEPTTLHHWAETDQTGYGTTVSAYLRVLDDGEERRIGRVVSHPVARNAGVAAQLMAGALNTTRGPWVLDAQSHLTAWYERFGFTVAGDEYIEDGIPHVPMRRAVSPTTS